jgi:hypothetical protein
MTGNHSIELEVVSGVQIQRPEFADNSTAHGAEKLLAWLKGRTAAMEQARNG